GAVPLPQLAAHGAVAALPRHARRSARRSPWRPPLTSAARPRPASHAAQDAGRGLELAFVMARRQNRFFVELVAAIRAELESLGVPSVVSHDGFPDPHPGRVYALVPPHEYMRLEGWRQSIPDELLRRTVFI